MPRTANLGLSLRIFGAENVSGRITQWRATTQDRIYAVLSSNVDTAVEIMQSQVGAAYPWGGKTAASITGEVEQSYTGPVVRISIANYREVKYMTTLLPDSDFRPGPYPIVAVNKERMVFYWQRMSRWVALKAVTHPGFGRDTIRESGEMALGYLGQRVEQEVRSAVAEIHSGGRTYSVSRRR